MTNDREELEAIRRMEAQAKQRTRFNVDYTTHVIALVREERYRQINLGKHGRIPHACEDPNTNPGYCLGVLGEEFGEVCKAVIEGSNIDQLQEELVQVAAVAVAWAEAIQRSKRELGNKSSAPDTQGDGQEAVPETQRGVVAGSRGIELGWAPATEDSKLIADEHMAVLVRAHKLYLERNKDYKDTWRKYGLRGSAVHLRTCVERAWQLVWGGHKSPVDNLLDTINYAVFAIRNYESDKSLDSWDYGG